MICQMRLFRALVCRQQFIANLLRWKLIQTHSTCMVLLTKFYTNSCLRAKCTWLSSQLPCAQTLCLCLQSSQTMINFVWWKGTHEFGGGGGVCEHSKRLHAHVSFGSNETQKAQKSTRSICTFSMRPAQPYVCPFSRIQRVFLDSYVCVVLSMPAANWRH